MVNRLTLETGRVYDGSILMEFISVISFTSSFPPSLLPVSLPPIQASLLLGLRGPYEVWRANLGQLQAQQVPSILYYLSSLLKFLESKSVSEFFQNTFFRVLFHKPTVTLGNACHSPLVVVKKWILPLRILGKKTILSYCYGVIKCEKKVELTCL